MQHNTKDTIQDGSAFALPTGEIWLSQVNTELGHASNRAIWLGNSDVRALAGRPSGAISMNDLRGKSAVFKTTMTVGHKYINAVDHYGFDNYTLDYTFGSLSNRVLDGHEILSFSSYSRRGSEYASLYIRNTTPYKTMQIKIGNIVANMYSSDMTSSDTVIVRLGHPYNEQVYNHFKANVGGQVAIEISNWSQ